MTKLAKRPVLLCLSFLLVAAIGCGGGGPNSTDPNVGVYLIVQQCLPTNGQEVLTDLADAGEEQDAGKITLRFSERLDPSTILDPNNAFNGLTSDVNVLDSAFARVPGTPTITGPRGNVLEFVPAGGKLPNGQYTVTVTRDVRSAFGGRLYGGTDDYHSSFTVGTDTYAPVIRNTFPVANQKGVGKTSDIIVTFNEALNPATVNSGSFQVAVTGNPPTPVNGAVTLSQDGFSIIFKTDAANPMPPNATIVVTVTGGSSGITDMVGNPFAGIPAGSDSYQFQFETVKEPPLPNNPSPVLEMFYGTSKGKVGTLDETGFANNPADLSGWGTNNPVQYSETTIQYNNSDGVPGEMVWDQRTNPTTGHLWFFVLDEKNRAIHVMSSQTCRVLYTWGAFRDPRGLSISGTRLFVTDFAGNTLSALDIASIGPPGSLGVPDQLKTLANANSKFRQDLTVGRGPKGCCCGPGNQLVITANAGDDSSTVVNTNTWQVVTTFSTGANPVEAEMSYPLGGSGTFGWVTCEGGGSTPDGGVSLYWTLATGLQANVTGFMNPTGMAYDLGIAVWVANTGSDTVSQLTLQVAGSGYAATILPNITATVQVGQNPVDVAMDTYFGLQGAPAAVVTADQGSSQLTFFDPAQPSRPSFSLPIAGVRSISGAMSR
jgi:hypothetical protein